MAVLEWITRHPRLSGWILLSLGTVIMLLIFASDVGLLPLQWAALIVATVLVSGLCIWIIGTDDDQKPLNRSLRSNLWKPLNSLKPSNGHGRTVDPT